MYTNTPLYITTCSRFALYVYFTSYTAELLLLNGIQMFFFNLKCMSQLVFPVDLNTYVMGPRAEWVYEYIHNLPEKILMFSFQTMSHLHTSILKLTSYMLLLCDIILQDSEFKCNDCPLLFYTVIYFYLATRLKGISRNGRPPPPHTHTPIQTHTIIDHIIPI